MVCGIMIKVLGLEAALESHPESAVQREIKIIGSAVDQAVYNTSAGALVKGGNLSRCSTVLTR
jgi:hypothetical protein